MSELTQSNADDRSQQPEKCKAPNCSDSRIGRLDWCNRHYQRIRRNGDLEPRKTGPKPRLPMLKCARCALSFKGTARQATAQQDGRPVYCSRGCQKAANLVTLPCAACGADVVRRAVDVRNGRTFCNAECRNRASKPRTGATKECLQCGTDFYVIKALAETARYCSVPCKTAAARSRQVTRECDHCGEQYTRAPSTIGRFCSKPCEHAFRTGNGAGYINADGYRVISQGSGKSAKGEHRLVVERLLGRLLLPTETVHHVNGVRHDNRADGPLAMDERGRLRSGNLELWSHSHPRGQEIGPKLDHARSLLALYGTPEEQERYSEYTHVVTVEARDDAPQDD
ncbi:hypothetical protein GTY65_24205 [Streptomyces sp. SID8379]|uniref:hypothetical protein n=1 Tax=unclassified Streptomyces TaxID=2593676 RepID=UPI00131A0DE2|nr:MULTISPECIES: hypothetical protein [unclassified Streptomyces]MYW67146.1 hypothetical protein [Streptomyces sp. SID8379]